MNNGKCVLLNIPKYEEILDGIEFGNSNCKLDNGIVDFTNKTVGTDSGAILQGYLNSLCDTTYLLERHIGIDLLSGLNLIKEAIIDADKKSADSLDIKRGIE